MEAQKRFEFLYGLLKNDTLNISLREDCIAATVESRNYKEAIFLAERGLEDAPHVAQQRLLSWEEETKKKIRNQQCRIVSPQCQDSCRLNRFH
jgi:hypothetical protein